eukprot:6464176-Amphidinium_carterae.1
MATHNQALPPELTTKGGGTQKHVLPHDFFFWGVEVAPFVATRLRGSTIEDHAWYSNSKGLLHELATCVYDEQADGRIESYDLGTGQAVVAAPVPVDDSSIDFFEASVFMSASRGQGANILSVPFQEKLPGEEMLIRPSVALAADNKVRLQGTPQNQAARLGGTTFRGLVPADAANM